MKMLELIKLNKSTNALRRINIPEQVVLAKKQGKNPTCLYWVTCVATNHFYIGITNNPVRRILQHRGEFSGGSFFVRKYGFADFNILAWFERSHEAAKAEQHYTHIMRRKYKRWTIAGARQGHLD